MRKFIEGQQNEKNEGNDVIAVVKRKRHQWCERERDRERQRVRQRERERERERVREREREREREADTYSITFFSICMFSACISQCSS